MTLLDSLVKKDYVTDEELAANMDSHDAGISPSELKKRIIESRGTSMYIKPTALPDWQKKIIQSIRDNWRKEGLE